MKLKERVSATKTTLLLGAGASFASDFNLPMMANFFDRPNDSVDTFSLVWEFVSRFYPQGTSRAEYNLEEMFAFLDLSRSKLPIWMGKPGDVPYHADHPQRTYLALADYVKRVLSIRTSSNCRMHAKLFKSLGDEDTILTLNYDLVADQTLLSIERENSGSRLYSRTGKVTSLLLGRSLGPGRPNVPTLLRYEKERGFYIKLHGSLDWLYCPYPDCPNHGSVFPIMFASSDELGILEGEPCKSCGATLETFIIPPVSSKRIEERGKLAFLWNIALRELRSSGRWVIFGVSFSPVDFELRWLLKQALDIRDATPLGLDIINPVEQHRQRIVGALADDRIQPRHFNSIDEYLSLIPMS